MSYNFTFIYFHCIAPIHECEYLLNNKAAPCAWSLCVPFFCADSFSSRFKCIAFGGDTGQTLTKLKVGSTKKEIRLIMNKFPSHPRGRDILFTTHFFGSLYPVNEISNTCEGTAFKLLFSLEAWRWEKKKEGFHQMTEELLPDPFRSENRAVLGNAISDCHRWDCLRLSDF